MPDQTPAELANQTAEAIRAINHLTMSPRDGWTYPSDAYSVVGGLSRMAMMLPQALEQIGALIEPSETGGHLYSDKGTLAADLENTYEGLAEARDAAQALYEALNRAHSGLSPIAYKD